MLAHRVRCFGGRLQSPDHYRRDHAGLVSYYALFKGMAASKPTSQLSQHNHILSYTKPSLRGLSRRSGFFPSRQPTLSPADCLPGSIQQAFGVWLGEVRLTPPEPIQCSTSCGLISRGHTKICFGENQLSPSLIGLSPLPSSHPSGFQPTTVRTSTTCYGRFILLKGRSPRLRVYRRQRRRPIQTRFRSGSGPKGLNLLPTSNSSGHNAKGTRSEDAQPKLRASSHRLLAHGFRFCFTRHLAFFSPFPHGTSALSVTEEYLALEGGPPSFPQDYTCPTVLGIPLGVANVRVPGCHRLWRAFPGHFGLVACSHDAVPQPRRSKLLRFGLSPVRSPLLRGSRLLSFPPGTEMFQFPGLARLAA
jgi:hypothetical protein